MRGREHVMVLLLTLSMVLNLIVGCVPGATLPTSTSSTVTSRPPTPSDLERAREALTTYFSLLHVGRYNEAVHYYGGDYNVLRDGTLFVQGPCCGATETEEPPQSQFTFTVKKADNRFLVEELPVYVP